MSWFIVVFLGSSPGNMGAYTFYNPVFDTQQECITHTKENARELGQKIGKDLGLVNIDSVYCLSKEQLKELTSPQSSEKTTI